MFLALGPDWCPFKVSVSGCCSGWCRGGPLARLEAFRDVRSAGRNLLLVDPPLLQLLCFSFFLRGPVFLYKLHRCTFSCPFLWRFYFFPRTFMKPEGRFVFVIIIHNVKNNELFSDHHHINIMHTQYQLHSLKAWGLVQSLIYQRHLGVHLRRSSFPHISFNVYTLFQNFTSRGQGKITRKDLRRFTISHGLSL